MFRVFAVLAALTLAAVAQAGDVSVEEGYVRAMPPGQPVSAAFMTLSNAGKQVRTVVAFSTPVAARAELHRSVREGDQVRMEELAQLTIAPGEQVKLAPGGLHLMLIGMQRSPSPGDEVSVTVQFQDGEKIEARLPVVDMRSKAAEHQHHHHH